MAPGTCSALALTLLLATSLARRTMPFGCGGSRPDLRVNSCGFSELLAISPAIRRTSAEARPKPRPRAARNALRANSIVDDAMYWNARKAALSADNPRQSPAEAASPLVYWRCNPSGPATRKPAIGSLATGEIVWRGLAPGSPRARNPSATSCRAGREAQAIGAIAAAERERGRRGNGERQRPCLLDPRAGRGVTNNRHLNLAFLPGSQLPQSPKAPTS